MKKLTLYPGMGILLLCLGLSGPVSRAQQLNAPNEAVESPDIPTGDDKKTPPGYIVGQKEHTTGKIQVYPNPSAGEFNIELPSGKVTAAVEVYSLTGKLVWMEMVDFKSSEGHIDLRDLYPGYYILKVENTSRKICIQN